MAEKAIRETGMEWALVRPSWIYGPGDRSMNRFVTFCRYFPVVPVIGDGKTPVYPIFVGDVARCVAEAARREDCKDKTLDLAGPERLTMDQIIRTVQKVLGTRRPLLHQVDMDPKPSQEYFGFSFQKLEEGLRTYLP